MQLFTIYKRTVTSDSMAQLVKRLYSKNLITRLSPIKNFFIIFYFFAFAKMQVFFRDLHVCRNKHVLMYHAQAKPIHSVKWRSLYGDTATMHELLLKTCTRLQGGKEYVLKLWEQRMH